MKYVIIATLFKLLSATVWIRQNLEVNLIKRLNEYFCFDHNIFLLDSLNEHNQHILAMDRSDGSISPQTVYIVDRNGTQRMQMENVQTSKTPFLIVVAAECFKFGNDTQMLDQVISIRQLNPNVKIGAFFVHNITAMETVLQLFQWSRSNRILNIFCAFYLNVAEDATGSSFTVFRFDPFDATVLLNLTGSESLQNYFPDEIPNYHEHPLRILQQYDSQFKNYEPNKFQFNFWQNIVRVFNASISMTYIDEAAYIKSRVKFFSSLNVDVTQFTINLNGDFAGDPKLGPFAVTRLVLLVPHARPYASFITYLQNTTWTVLFAYTLLVTVAASLLLTVSGYLHTNKISLLQCFVDVINLLVNDNTAINYGRLYRADVYIVVPLTFTGLIVANGILSVFKSYLTLPIYEGQIKTINELFESRVRISAREITWANETIELLENLTRHSGWNEKIQRTNMDIYFKNLNEFNDSVAYSTLDYSARYVLTAQKRLNLKAYYLIDTVLCPYFLTFDVDSDFPYIEAINMVSHRLASAGLIRKWLKEVDEDEIKRITKLNLGRQFNSSDQSDSDFGMMTIVWCGWLASIFVFICELICNKIQSQITKLKQTLRMHYNLAAQ